MCRKHVSLNFSCRSIEASILKILDVLFCGLNFFRFRLNPRIQLTARIHRWGRVARAGTGAPINGQSLHPLWPQMIAAAATAEPNPASAKRSNLIRVRSPSAIETMFATIRSMQNVVTRVAPSPTGRMHIATARVALFNFLHARHVGGTFILRIEDTDPARDKPEYEDDIKTGLRWLGIEWDEFHRQSENKDAHARAIKKLIDSGHAYVSKEPAKDDATREVEVVRFKNPNSLVVFYDELRGDVAVQSNDLGDFVIARSVTDPVHHLAVVCDDAAQGVTLVMRGEDLLSNTPRQILIQEALGLPRPRYLHLPIILGTDRTKLSKRRHATSVGDFRARGYLPEAMINFISLLGWNPGTDQEIFTMNGLIAEFSLSGVQKSGAVFNEEKLRWINREHMLRMTPEAFWEHAEEYLSAETVTMLDAKGLWQSVVPLMRERIATFDELRLADEAGEYRYFFEAPILLRAEVLIPRGESASPTKARLERILALLEGVLEPWTPESVKAAVWDYAEEDGRSQVLWPMRVALTGRDKSPDPFTVAGIIGKDESIARVRFAVSRLPA